MFFPSLAHAMGAAPSGGGAGGNPITAFLPLILMKREISISLKIWKT